MWLRFKGALQAESPPKTHGVVVAQVWRGTGHQARLAADHGDQIITSRLNPTHIPADDFPPTRLVALVAGAGVVTVDPLLHHRLVAQVDPFIEHLGDNVGRGRAHRRIR